jgi:halimadienyl-diphosphate synthase
VDRDVRAGEEQVEKSMKEHIIDVLFTDLRHVVAAAGKGGGQISPSIYDTAQVLRFSPPRQGVDAAIDWLLNQQQPDGGWGTLHVARSREVPTLATILALKAHGKGSREREAIAAGLGFLRQQSEQWVELPDDLLSGIELTLPRLIDDAAAAGLEVLSKAYSALSELRRRRLDMLSKIQIRAGSTAVFSWEAWGREPDPALVDHPTGGIGSSPAATAAWVRAASSRPELSDMHDAAIRYLEKAAASTPVALPGVVPASWPNDRFEQAWVLYALQNADLLAHPRLRDVARPTLDELHHALRDDGIGFNDVFTPDGDLTATTTLILHRAGYQVKANAVERFQKQDHFYTYPGEIQPSLTTTAHAMLALAFLKRETSQFGDFFAARQCADGIWQRDKWHTSWLYTTSRILRTLIEAKTHQGVLEKGVRGLLGHQRADGGWGAGKASTTAETAYAVLAMIALSSMASDTNVSNAIQRAGKWLLRNYRPFNSDVEPLWIGKDLYYPHRIDRSFELAALVATVQSSERVTE